MGDTLYKRPQAPRPENGLLAWLATVGYISAEYNVTTWLELRAHSSGDVVLWDASLTWGDNAEEVRNFPSLPQALRELWKTIAPKHTLFKTLDAAAKQPAFYNDDRWLDPTTQSVLDRLLGVITAEYGADWTLMIVYQPVEDANLRTQAQLSARTNTVRIAGQGASVGEACHHLYRSIPRTPGTGG